REAQDSQGGAALRRHPRLAVQARRRGDQETSVADSMDFTRLDIHRKRSLPVRDFFVQFREELSLILRTPEASLATEIIESSLHRPGLALAGFTQVYSYQRVQILGTTEWFYLESVGPDKRREIFDSIREFRSPLWVLTHNASPHEELLEMCRE